MAWLLRWVAFAVAAAIVTVSGQLHQQRLQSESAAMLFRAIDANQPAHVATLLNQGVRPNISDDFGTPALSRAARHQDPALITLLLRAGAKVDQRDADGGTALMHAAGWGSMSVLLELLAAGADVNATTSHGWTALHHAANHGRERVIRILIHAGASVSARRMDGTTPLRLALSRRHGAAVRTLVRSGAMVEPKDRITVAALLAQPRSSRAAREAPPRWAFETTGTLGRAGFRRGVENSRTVLVPAFAR